MRPSTKGISIRKPTGPNNLFFSTKFIGSESNILLALATLIISLIRVDDSMAITKSAGIKTSRANPFLVFAKANILPAFGIVKLDLPTICSSETNCESGDWLASPCVWYTIFPASCFLDTILWVVRTLGFLSPLKAIISPSLYLLMAFGTGLITPFAIFTTIRSPVFIVGSMEPERTINALLPNVGSAT